METRDHFKNGGNRRNIFKLVGALFVGCFVFVGCSFEEVEVGGNEDGGKVKLLESVVIGNEEYNKYEYDAQDRLIKMTSREEPGYLETWTFTYNSANELIKHTRNSTTFTYTKNGNIIQYETSDSQYGMIELSAKELPIKHSLNSLKSVGEYVYQNDNLTEIIYKGTDGKISSTYTFTYDDKKSPFSHCKTPKWVFTVIDTGYRWAEKPSINNVTTDNEVLYRENGTLALRYSSIVTYTYDSDGYPITATITEKETDNSGNTTTIYVLYITYKYITK